MVHYLLSVFPAMLLGAQLLLTVILVKGDLCPGQRGRIHKMLPSIGLLWLAVASLKIEVFLVVFAVFYFYSQVKTGKTRDVGPIWLLYLANGLALSFVGIQISEQANTLQSLAYLVLVFLLGASFAHLLLTVARTRLQAFHKILPVSIVLSAMVFISCALFIILALEESELTLLFAPLMTFIVLLLVGVVVSCWHLLTTKQVSRPQLTVSLLLLISASTLSSSLFAI